VIEISARYSEREVTVVIAHVRGTGRPLRTQLNSPDRTEGPPGDARPAPDGQPSTPLAHELVSACEAVQAVGVDELSPVRSTNQRVGEDALAFSSRSSTVAIARSSAPPSHRINRSGQRSHLATGPLTSSRRAGCNQAIVSGARNKRETAPQVPAAQDDHPRCSLLVRAHCACRSGR